MDRIITCQLVFLVMLTITTATIPWKHQIIVDSKNGVNDFSCWERGYSTPCQSLNLALKGAQHYIDSITILLQPGRYELHNGSETQLRSMSQLAIVGNSSQGEPVVIQCKQLTGLAFFDCNEITIQNLITSNCGMLHINPFGDFSPLLENNVAIFFSSCSIILLNDVSITKSNGTGVVLYNSVGTVEIDSCTFLHNSLTNEEAISHKGGGLAIEIDNASYRSSYIISNCTFASNTDNTKLSPFKPSQGGGGISIVFRGEATNNMIQINNVCLDDNRALQMGGGMFLGFYDSANSNNIVIHNISVTGNRAMLNYKVGTLLSLLYSTGGGISINFVASDIGYPFNNTIEINTGWFFENVAQLGGGLAVIVDYENVTTHVDTSASNILLIENCVFDGNIAYGQGASAYFMSSNISSFQKAPVNATISFSNFTNCICGENTGSSLFLNNFSLKVKGSLLFHRNNFSALSLRSSSSIELMPSTKLEFTDNNGLDGGAINIIECSSIIVNNNTELYFESNKARYYGGAIYAEACSQTKGDCFIRHSNPAISPDEWNANFSFYGNRASILGDSIYTDSILSCVWSTFKKNETFCWKEWSYWSIFDPSINCQDQIKSGPARITSGGFKPDHSIYPGQCIDLLQYITVYDDWGNEIIQANLKTSLLFGAAQIVSDSNCKCVPSYKFDKCDLLEILPEQKSCENHEIALLSVSCNSDYVNRSVQVFVHLPHQLNGVVLEFTFKVCNNGFNDLGSCTTFDDGPSVYDHVCKNGSSSMTLPCINTVSTLCGSCAEDQNLSIAINSPQFDCIKCDYDDTFSGVGFYLLEIFFVLVMMMVLAIFHINITNGNLNAYILYSQMLTLQFPVQGYVAWVPLFQAQITFFPQIKFLFIVYSIWNLNFFVLLPNYICIPELRNALYFILLQYIIAILPLLFIIISYIWIKWYNNGYRFVVYTTRPVHQLLARIWQKCNIQPSLIDTYAGLLLLSYMRFLAVSAKFLQFIIVDQRSPFPTLSLIETFLLVLVALLCLLVFVIFPMIGLLSYPFKIFQQCLTCCRLDRPGLHALVDAYQGCFKNRETDGSERRHFAGLYLLFRFICVAVYVYNFVFITFGNKYHFMIKNDLFLILPIIEASVCLVMAGLISLLRPYKKNSHNIIDFFTLLFMCILPFQGILFILPFIILLIYIMFRVFQSCCCYVCKTKNTSHNSEAATPSEQLPLLASAPPTRSEVTIDNPGLSESQIQ